MTSCKHNGRLRPLAGLLLRVATLGVLVGSSPAWAGIYQDLTEELCMADASAANGGSSTLNCTANDVEITKVVPDPGQTCEEGKSFTFNADVTVRTNANERYDTTFYLPNDVKVMSPMDPQNGEKLCSLVLPKAEDANGAPPYAGAYVNIDGDACADITKANSTATNEYTLEDQSITMLCQRSEPGSDKALFTYCAAWDNKTGDNCSATDEPPGQTPSTRSKCNCDSFAIDVIVIRPDPAVITKTVEAPTSRVEPGGEFTFSVNIPNDSEASLFITSLKDVIDMDGDGNYGEVGVDKTIDLWKDPVVTAPTNSDPDGAYLIANTCDDGGAGPVEVEPDDAFGCEFTLHIKRSQLPAATSVVDYFDFIFATYEDKDQGTVGDGSSCEHAGPAYVADGNSCSEEKKVSIENDPPDISSRFALKAVGFVSIRNNSTVESLTVTGLTFKGVDVADGANDNTAVLPAPDNRTFTLYNDTDSFGNHETDANTTFPVGFCAIDTEILPEARYTCAISLELKPGLLPLGNIDFAASNPAPLVVTLQDNDGNETTAEVEMTIKTIE